jgi:alpha-methylacyl-CoA racemase
MTAGPLAGVRVVELAGLAPAPFGCMVLADLGADVIQVDRPGGSGAPPTPMQRSRRTVTLDLKTEAGVGGLLRLAARADVLVEGYRPGVAERLGFGPATIEKINPRLVYARMTGWGQQGPLADRAGHDIDYIALAGALDPIGRRGGPPTPPINLVGDFGGGGLLLAFGVTCALLERQRSGRGQVVDAAMVDGAAALMTVFHGAQQSGWWREERGTNLIDTGSHFYDTYETADGKYVAIGAIEPQFYAELLQKIGVDPNSLPAQLDRERWPEAKESLARLFKTKTRAEWCAILEGSDACFAPVLSMSEARRHPHNVARQAFVEVAGVAQPGPAPRFSRTPAEIQRPPARAGEHTEEALRDWGFSPDEIRALS